MSKTPSQPHPNPGALAKRLLDILASALGLLVLSPFFVILAWWIKRDSPGPVFYHGRRAGRHGREFHILKFRTMYERPEDGKTIVVGNLACVFAQGGRKVVVVDADLRRPRVHKVFQLPNRFGLTDQFIRPQEYLDGAVQPTEVKNLFALTSGSLPPNPSELLGSQRMVEIVQTLEAQFELVVMDAPPSLVVTDANVLANRADGVLLVICPSISKRAAIKHTIEQLAQVNANIVGVVLNGVDVKKSRYYYYRGYYHKYGRGYATYLDAESSGIGKRKSRKASIQETTLPPEIKNPSDQQDKNS